MRAKGKKKANTRQDQKLITDVHDKLLARLRPIYWPGLAGAASYFRQMESGLSFEVHLSLHALM